MRANKIEKMCRGVEAWGLPKSTAKVGIRIWGFVLYTALSGGCSDGGAANDAQGTDAADTLVDSYEVCAQHSDCDDGNECTKDLCGITQRCGHMVEVAIACNDGDPCTQGALCMEDGTCGGPTVGPMPAPACLQCTCDFVEGMVCESRPVGSECVDQNPCTIGETCSEDNRCQGDDPCAHGECNPMGENFDCVCDVGWSGSACDVPVD